MRKGTHSLNIYIPKEEQDEFETILAFYRDKGMSPSRPALEGIRRRYAALRDVDFEDGLAAMSPDAQASESNLGKTSSVVVGSATPTS